MNDPILEELMGLDGAELMAALKSMPHDDLETLQKIYPEVCEKFFTWRRSQDEKGLEALYKDLRDYYDSL